MQRKSRAEYCYPQYDREIRRKQNNNNNFANSFPHLCLAIYLISALKYKIKGTIQVIFKLFLSITNNIAMITL